MSNAITATIEGRDVIITQPYPDTVLRLFNVHDVREGRRVAILLRLAEGRWRCVRTDLGDLMDPTELDAEDVQEAARQALAL